MIPFQSGHPFHLNRSITRGIGVRLLWNTHLTLPNRTIPVPLCIQLKQLPEFDTWLDGLKDRIPRLRLSRRLDKAQRGNLGDVKPIGKSVFEMKEHFGPG